MNRIINPYKSIQKVLIGIPFGRRQDLIPHRSWVALLISASLSSSYALAIKYAENVYVEVNRENIAQTALDKGCDWCLMIDTDMSYRADILDILMSRNKDVIGVPYYSPDYDSKTGERIVTPLIYDYNETKQVWDRWKSVEQIEPFEVDAVATGIMLVKTDVFRKLKKPWFPLVSSKNARMIGEDLSFCKKCKDAGFEIWVDPTFEDDIEHWKPYGYSKKDCTG